MLVCQKAAATFDRFWPKLTCEILDREGKQTQSDSRYVAEEGEKKDLQYVWTSLSFSYWTLKIYSIYCFSIYLVRSLENNVVELTSSPTCLLPTNEMKMSFSVCLSFRLGYIGINGVRYYRFFRNEWILKQQDFILLMHIHAYLQKSRTSLRLEPGRPAWAGRRAGRTSYRSPWNARDSFLRCFDRTDHRSPECRTYL